MNNNKTVNGTSFDSQYNVQRFRNLGFEVIVQHKREFKNKKEVLKTLSKSEKCFNIFDHIKATGGKTIVCLIKNNIKTIGKSVCNPNEHFCKEIGISYALERAYEKFLRRYTLNKN